MPRLRAVRDLVAAKNRCLVTALDGRAGLYWWPAPAANYGCIANLPGCTVCRPNPQPCSEFQGRWSDLWCPCCGWAAWAHVDGGGA
jgi:hypothetical protein